MLPLLGRWKHTLPRHQVAAGWGLSQKSHGKSFCGVTGKNEYPPSSGWQLTDEKKKHGYVFLCCNILLVLDAWEEKRVLAEGSHRGYARCCCSTVPACSRWRQHRQVMAEENTGYFQGTESLLPSLPWPCIGTAWTGAEATGWSSTWPTHVIFSNSSEVVMYTSKYIAVPIQRMYLLCVRGYIANVFSGTACETLLDFPKIIFFLCKYIKCAYCRYPCTVLKPSTPLCPNIRQHKQKLISFQCRLNHQGYPNIFVNPKPV